MKSRIPGSLAWHSGCGSSGPQVCPSGHIPHRNAEFPSAPALSHKIVLSCPYLAGLLGPPMLSVVFIDTFSGSSRSSCFHLSPCSHFAPDLGKALCTSDSHPAAVCTLLLWLELSLAACPWGPAQICAWMPTPRLPNLTFELNGLFMAGVEFVLYASILRQVCLIPFFMGPKWAYE